MLGRPPLPPKDGVARCGRPSIADKPSTNSSFAAAKALFEAAKKPEVRNAAVAASKNPVVRSAAQSAAKDPHTRQLVMEALAKQHQADSAKPAPPHKQLSPETEKPPVPRHGSATTSNYNTQPTKYTPPTPSYSSNTSSYGASGTTYNKPLPSLNDYGSAPRTPYAPPKPASSMYPSITDELNALNLGQHKAPSRPAPPVHRSAASPTKDPYAVVLYPFSGAQFDELTSEVGDKILLKREVDEQWIYGMNTTTGKHGIIPLSYLEIKVPLVPTQGTASSSAPYGASGFTGVAPMAPPNIGYPYKKEVPANTVIALYDYNTGVDGDLQFFAGDSIVATEWKNDEWLCGEIYGKNGIFPANFVDTSTLGNLPRAAAKATSSAAGAAVERVTVTYDYDSGVSEDLKCRAGDVIEVVEHVNADWIKGRHAGRMGLIPKTFIQMDQGSASATPSQPIEINREMTVIVDYPSMESGHLSVTKGDKVLIMEDVDDYWYRGKVTDSAFRFMPPGFIPKNCVQ